jgi:hypothetical protein
MGKTKYNPQAAILPDPMAELRARAQETIARQAQEPQSGTEEEVLLATVSKTETESLAVESVPSETPLAEGRSGESPAPAQIPRFVPPVLAVAPDKPKKIKGKPQGFTFWLYPEDIAKMRQLSAFLSSSYEMRTNDSLIVRAALRCISANDNLHESVCEALQSDRRRRKSQD